MGKRSLITWLNERFSRGSIRSTMFASFTVSAVVAILLTGATLFARFSAQMDATIEEENQILVDQVNQSLSTYLRDVIRLSDSLSYNVIKNTDMESERLDERMRLLYNTYSDYVENIALFDSAGALVATAPPARLREGADVRERDWFRRAMERTENIHFGGPTVENLFADDAYRWVIPLSCAVELTRGRETGLGVLLIDLKYQAVSDLFSSVQLSGNGYVYLIDGAGELIYHPARQRIATGLVEETNLDAARRSDGVYTEYRDGQLRSVIVRGVGYTGWKAVGVVSQPGFRLGGSQDILFTVVIFCAFFALLILMNFYLTTKITDPIRLLEESVARLEQSMEGSIYVGGTTETRTLGQAVQKLVDQMRKLTDDIVREHEEKQKSELNALQAQINPHFLYNTLDTIVWMIENEREEDAARAVTALARFFRISLSKGRNIIPVRDELEHVRNYLLIQEMRYKNKFRYEILSEPAVEELSTIKLVVQPIVENAIYHSMDFMDGGDGLIRITARLAEGELQISVEDNGLGMTPQVVEGLLAGSPAAEPRVPGRGSGIGLKNVQDRIRLYFGAQYGVTIDSEPDAGTLVTLHMPTVPFGEMEES
ncbi:histidine kinase [Candidatus Pseudoscillospira sp. SGI.172]|uniref:histidine kinase n=1 Tax=Candidatus Pseudoscillospira sp. SGI.172 TaxID=3420582 RepID=UPI003D068732